LAAYAPSGGATHSGRQHQRGGCRAECGRRRESPETGRGIRSRIHHDLERFSFGTAESDYEECGAFNTAARNQQWSALWSLGNAASPLNRFKDGTISAQVQSRFLRVPFQDLAQVRF
jgi:hypothetical protein